MNWKIKIQEFLFHIVLIFIFLGPFFYFDGVQETDLTNQLEKCSVYTVIYPIEFRGSSLYFNYYLNGNRKEASSSCAADDIGGFGMKGDVLNELILIQLNCDTTELNRVRFEYIVPETLKPPIGGWKTLPKGLILRDGDWFYNNYVRGRYIDWY